MEQEVLLLQDVKIAKEQSNLIRKGLALIASPILTV